jgi:preprotein translocase subunit YajC
MQNNLRLGDEIITAGGLHAYVRALDEDVLTVEIAPGTNARLDRRAVAAVVTPEPAPEALEEPVEEPAEEGAEPISRGES